MQTTHAFQLLTPALRSAPTAGRPAKLALQGTREVELLVGGEPDPARRPRPRDDVVRAGKARYIGASSMFAWQFAKAQRTACRQGGAPFVSMQNHYNLVYREEEREMIPLCLDQGVGVIPYSPLARGLLSGSRQRGEPRATVRAGSDPLADEMYRDSDFDVVDAVNAVADRRGVCAAKVALAWLLSKPAVTAPIVGATKLEHVDDAIAAIDLTLAAEDVAQLEAPYQPHPVLGHH